MLVPVFTDLSLNASENIKVAKVSIFVCYFTLNSSSGNVTCIEQWRVHGIQSNKHQVHQ